MSRSLQPSRGGTLYLTIVGAALLLGVLMSALFSTAKISAQYALTGSGELEARYAAHAAIQRAFGELARDPEWRTGWTTRTQLVQNPELTYTLEVRDNAFGTALAENEVFLYAQGYSIGDLQPVPLAALAGTAVRPGGKFGEAGFGFTEFTMKDNSKSDAFDSRVGDHWYNPDEDDDDRKTLVADAGHVGSAKVVELHDSQVEGDVVLPDPTSFQLDGTTYSGQAEVLLSGSGGFSGEEQRPKKKREIPRTVSPYPEHLAIASVLDVDTLEVEDSYPTLEPGPYNRLEVRQDQKLRLTSGSYFFHELDLKGATLVLDRSGGPIKVFVGESASIVDSTINKSQVDEDNENPKPSDFQLLFTDLEQPAGAPTASSKANIVDSYFNGVISGKGLDLEVEGSDLFGAIVGKTVRLDSSKLHYDKATEDIDLSNHAQWRLRDLVSVPTGK